MSLPIPCLDFDGVCHSYTTEWEATEIIPDSPVEGLWEFLWEASQHFDIHIFSSRSAIPSGIEAMKEWFIYNFSVDSTITNMAVGMGEGPNFISWMILDHPRGGITLEFPIVKPPAFLTLDDRALLFTGTWPQVQELLDFKPWNKK